MKSKTKVKKRKLAIHPVLVDFLIKQKKKQLEPKSIEKRVSNKEDIGLIPE